MFSTCTFIPSCYEKCSPYKALGPLINPAQPKYQFVGVYSLELARLYSYLLQKHNKKFTIVFSLDGYDEISLTDDFKIIKNNYEDIINPKSLGLKKNTQEEIFNGNTIESSARLFISILDGKGTPAQNNTAIINAAYAINCYKPEINIIDAIEIAKESLFSGKAKTSLLKVLYETSAVKN
jgi:anthranilate phosphoribosyltransferase